MESAPVTFEIRDGYLLVIATGLRTTLAGMVNNTNLVYSKAVEVNKRKILLDGRGLEFHINRTEAFNLIKMYEVKFPDSRGIKLAGVFNKNQFELVSLWQEIGAKRGFEIKIFQDFSEAENWLQTQ